MRKYFNVAGPCAPDEHYMLPAAERIQGIFELIDQKQYFVIHAARQSGKTTLLQELTKQVNADGQYHALYCSVETAQKIDAPEQGISAIMQALATQMRFHRELQRFPFADRTDAAAFTIALRESLTYLCEALEKPLIIFFDEVDCLSNGTLISFLRQLRDGYVNRWQIPFMRSVALVGMRNIRDYKGKIRDDRETLGSASPFNIATEALTLRNFTIEEISRLYAQHTDQTGQIFSAEVIHRISDVTQGQPWLVNAIAREIVTKILEHDPARPILPEYVEQAVETLMQTRPTHLDSLMERLREERVRRILEPVLMGVAQSYSVFDDDYQYTLDLGLLSESAGNIQPSNPIYGEVIVRTLTSQARMTMQQQAYPPEAPAYFVNGRLDMRRILTDFQEFWRENSAIWVEKYEYKEAAPHLILQAFLSRIVNSGGQIRRELASGRERLDLCVEYQGQRYPIEVKLRYDRHTIDEGQQQLAGYLDTLGCAEGWLVLFDRRKRASWKQKIFWRTTTVAGKAIHVVGC